MNQILQKDLDKDNFDIENESNINLETTKSIRTNLALKKSKFIFKIQFSISILLLSIIVYLITNNLLNLYKKENYSSQILENYNITRLYSNSNKNLDNFENSNSTYVIGILEIPKINIYYPVFSTCNETLLQISPCKVYGPLPGKTGNLCIAGHNYDNTKFFSKIVSLNINDEIILYDNSNKKFSYFVSDIYEVKNDNVSPIYSYDKNLKQLTLITCNNLNNNRIIVKALL